MLCCSAVQCSVVYCSVAVAVPSEKGKVASSNLRHALLQSKVVSQFSSGKRRKKESF